MAPAPGAGAERWRRWLPYLALGAVLALLCVLPFHMRSYHVELAIIFFINLILAVSYRLVTTTGDWGFAHVVLQGAGGYATALIAKHLGLPFIVVLPLSGLVAAAIGFAFIVPLLRTLGFGFFIASFAIGELLRMVWMKVVHPFGGTGGIINIPMPELFGLKLVSSINYYFATLIVTLICVFLMYRLDRSRIGDAWKAIHTDGLLAECLGIDVGRYRSLAFATGAFFAGVAGSLLAYRMGAIDPHNFEITNMVYLVIWVVIGGSATFWGPIIGVTVITVAFEWTRFLLEWRPMLFGSILILFLIFLPGGIEGLIPRIGASLRRPPGSHLARLRVWLTTLGPRGGG